MVEGGAHVAWSPLVNLRGDRTGEVFEGGYLYWDDQLVIPTSDCFLKRALHKASTWASSSRSVSETGAQVERLTSGAIGVWVDRITSARCSMSWRGQCDGASVGRSVVSVGSRCDTTATLWSGLSAGRVREPKFSRKVVMSPTRPRQKLAAGLLLYATYLAWHCPCGRVLSCHLPHYFLSVGGATLIVINDLIR